MWETALNVGISFVFAWKWKETKLELKYVKMDMTTAVV